MILSPKSDGNSTGEATQNLPYVRPLTTRRHVHATAKVILVAKSWGYPQFGIGHLLSANLLADVV